MNRKVVTAVSLFIIGGLLAAFSINLPVLGHKKLIHIEETSSYEVISYNCYGKKVSTVPVEGEAQELLTLFQQQRILQQVQSGVLFSGLVSLGLWWSCEKRWHIYSSLIICLLFLIWDIWLVFLYN
ncbi:hypothetical protein [Halobacillus massiliensis]|uniref:hypothetical protein n=1 Tax=Halobacillus massiliensis TaxID=1926286 RepID=UPI0009E5185D|nr:hypothetical protein [Halobacillus massiliensis]